MARTSAALKSLVHGVTTDKERLANKIFLKQQTNFRTLTGIGLEKRPPSVVTKTDILGGVDPDNIVVIKKFELSGKINNLVVIHDQAENLLDSYVVDETGTKQTTTIEATNYLQGILTKNDLEITTQNDIVFVINKTKTVLMSTEKTIPTPVSLIKVQTAPAGGTVLTITYSTTLAGVTQINTLNYTVGTGELARSTNFIASELSALINGAVGDTTAVFGGSIVQLQHPNQESSAVDVVDGDAENVLLAINDRVENTTQLTRYGEDGTVLEITPNIQDAGLTIYVKAELDTTISTDVNPPGIINTTPDVTVTAESEPTPSSFLTPDDDIRGKYYIPIGSGGLSGGSSTPDSLFTNTLRLEQIVNRVTNQGGDIVLYEGVPPNLAQAATPGIPPGSIQTIHITNTSGLILAGGNTTESIYTVDGTNYAEYSLPAGDLVLQAGVDYRIHINEQLSSVEAPPLVPVVWKETSKPGEEFKLDAGTMPQWITQNSIVSVDWEEKSAGNNVSNPNPVFVGNKIKGLRVFQNRLVALTGTHIQTTETDNNLSWWRNTNSQVLSTQPVSIRSTAINQEEFHALVNHNKDLLIFTNEAQFKINGNTPLTPGTGSMVQTTTYKNYDTVKPVSIGKNVYFTHSKSNKFIGLSKYSASSDENEQDRADSLTDHVKDYLTKQESTILGDASKGIIFVINANTIKVVDLDPRITNAKFKRFAWSEWKLSTTVEIMDSYIDKDKLMLVTRRTAFGGNFYDLVVIEINENTANADTIYLDYQTSGTLTEVLASEVFAAIGSDQDFEIVFQTSDDNHGRVVKPIGTNIADLLVEVDPNTTLCTIGQPYKASIIPQRQYIRDASGIVNSFSKLRIVKWLVHLVNAADVVATIHSKWHSQADQTWSGFISGDIDSLTDNEFTNSGVFHVEYNQDAKDADLELHSSSHLPLTITEIEWLGGYNSRGRRF